MDTKKEFLALRKQYIEKRFSALNPQQREAALSCDGACLILAGAGSGKTTVVVNRIMCMLQFGNAYESDYVSAFPSEEDVQELHRAVENDELPGERVRLMLRAGNIHPWNILAITFTNKAANELKERITRAVGDEGRDVFASTFHSACVRFLRRDADRLGWPQKFTIYDADDAEKVVKDIYKSFGIDDKLYPVRWMTSRFGDIKDNLMDAEGYAAEHRDDPRTDTVCKVYNEYQRRLKEAGAFDFDDLIYYSVKLLSENEDIREYYHNRFRYVMVDEYQDTSHAQFMLIKLLTNEHNNIFVVGDDDQSIYSFRGATVENILNFDKQFHPVKVVRLEQNYRSTSNILGCANSVIAKNNARKGKNLWTAGDEGAKVHVHVADDAVDEAAYISADIAKHYRQGIPFSAHAVLYRANAQSNSVETYFSRNATPYKIVGGMRFFDRAEVKDIMSYLQLIVNPSDDLRLKRIINRPARKIGDTTIERMQEIASGLGESMMYVIMHCRDFPSISRAAGSLENFSALYRTLCEMYEDMSLGDFTDRLLDETGYRKMLEAMGLEGETKLQYVNEFVSSVRNYEIENPDGDLAAFLEETALITSLDTTDDETDAVTLMTIHSAKGLEFDYVYMIGMEDGLFPLEKVRYNSSELEEERRLAYVGMTRARKELHLIRAESRMIYGMTRRNPESRFVSEIDPQFIEESGNYRKKQTYLDQGYGDANRKASATVPVSSKEGFGGAKPTASAAPRQKFKPSNETYLPGDIVNHRMFGRGTIVSVTPIGGDVLLEIDFDRAGRKKTMANYAPLSKVEE